MKSLLLYCLLGLPPWFQVVQHPQPEPTPGKQIITAEMLQEIGVVRLADLFQLIEGGSFTTIDGFHGECNPGSLNPFRTNRWVIFVDGLPFILGHFGASDLSSLPINLHDIAFVEVAHIPQFHEGIFAERGLIHIHTKQLANGISVRGSSWTGNETGDSGPLHYLGKDGTVDRLGPDIEGTVSWRGAWGWARASIITRSHHPSDPALVQRNSAISGDWPIQFMIAPSMRFHIDGGDSYHDLSVGFTRLSDFVFLKPFGREIPAKTFAGWGGLNGALQLTERTQLRYRTCYSVNQLAERMNRDNLDFDWRLDLLSVNVEARRRGPAYLSTAGTTLELTKARTGYRLSDRAYRNAGLYYRMQRITSSSFRPDLTFQLSTNGDDVALRSVLGASWHVRPGSALMGTLAYSERFFKDDHGLWYWTRNGYGFLDDLNVDYVLAESFSRSRTMTADLCWQGTQTHDLRLKLQAYYRYFADLAMERQVFQFDPEEAAFGGPVRVESQLGGQVVGGMIGLDHSITPGLLHRFSAGLQTDIAGDALFRDAWQSLPALQVHSIWTLTPVQNFSMGAVLYYRSSSHWIEYIEVESQSGGLYKATVPAAWTVDLSAHKWFWRQRIGGTVVVRNLFNRQYRYHPIGAAFDLSLIVRLEFQFGTSQTVRSAIAY